MFIFGEYLEKSLILAVSVSIFGKCLDEFAELGSILGEYLGEFAKMGLKREQKSANSMRNPAKLDLLRAEISDFQETSSRSPESRNQRTPREILQTKHGPARVWSWVIFKGDL